MAIIREALSETERKVLLFVADKIDKASGGLIESTGLAENAVAQGIVGAYSTFTNTVAKLKYQGIVDSARAGRVALYELTNEGKQEVQRLRVEEQKIETGLRGDGDMVHKPAGSKGSIEDQLKKGMSEGKIPSIYGSYTPPQGLALPKDGQYSKDVKGLIELFKDRINPRADENEQGRIKEWFEKLTASGQPAFFWIQEAICKTSTKVKAEQRTIAYVIGILKSWGKYGYGTDYNMEQRKMFEKFEERFGYELSPDARQKLISLVDAHGIVDTMEALFLTDFSVPPIDYSVLVVDAMMQRLSSSGEEAV